MLYSLICAIFAPLFLIYLSVMRRIKYIFIFVLLAGAFFSCGNANEAGKPSAVALELYEGLTSGDVEAVTGNIHFQDSLDYNVFRDYFQMAVASSDYKQRTQAFKPDYKVTSEKISGDEAFVVLEGIGPLGNMLKIDVKLLFVEGKWKVDGNHGVFHSEPMNKK